MCFATRWGAAAAAVFACTRDLIMRQPGLCMGSGPACTRQPPCLAARTACPNSVPAALAASGLNVSISVLGILPAGGYPRAANLSVNEPREPVDTPQASAGHEPGLVAYPAHACAACEQAPGNFLLLLPVPPRSSLCTSCLALLPLPHLLASEHITLTAAAPATPVLLSQILSVCQLSVSGALHCTAWPRTLHHCPTLPSCPTADPVCVSAIWPWCRCPACWYAAHHASLLSCLPLLCCCRRSCLCTITLTNILSCPAPPSPFRLCQVMSVRQLSIPGVHLPAAHSSHAAHRCAALPCPPPHQLRSCLCTSSPAPGCAPSPQSDRPCSAACSARYVRCGPQHPQRRRLYEQRMLCTAGRCGSMLAEWEEPSADCRMCSCCSCCSPAGTQRLQAPGIRAAVPGHYHTTTPPRNDLHAHA